MSVWLGFKTLIANVTTCLQSLYIKKTQGCGRGLAGEGDIYTDQFGSWWQARVDVVCINGLKVVIDIMEYYTVLLLDLLLMGNISCSCHLPINHILLFDFCKIFYCFGLNLKNSRLALYNPHSYLQYILLILTAFYIDIYDLMTYCREHVWFFYSANSMLNDRS